MDGSIKEKFSGSKLTVKNGFAALGVMALVLMTVGGVVAQSSGGTEAVELGQNGIFVNQGTLDMKGNDIQSAGTTIWDASAGEVPSSVVGLNLSNSAGEFLTYDSANDELDVNDTSIQSGTTASDVGLGNVENIALSSAGWADIGIDQSDVSKSDVGLGALETQDGNLKLDGHLSFYLDDTFSANTLGLEQHDFTGSDNIDSYLQGPGSVVLEPDTFDTGTNPYCLVNPSGNLECSGDKSWVHDLNSTHEAVYSAQESPQTRAVYEGQVNVSDGRVNVSLPYHFSGTVSDERPSLRVQATPHSLANVAVTERTDEWVVIESDFSETVEVDYRVTGIREGYEDKQVVRPKE